jgi:hypothetical protein
MLNWSFRSKRHVTLIAALVAGVSPTTAQQIQGGRVADSTVGKVGQRQTRDAAASIVVPTGRIDGRIPSRIQSRIRNRIDRFYSPQANAASPFTVAQDQARVAGHSTRK